MAGGGSVGKKSTTRLEELDKEERKGDQKIARPKNGEVVRVAEKLLKGDGRSLLSTFSWVTV